MKGPGDDAVRTFVFLVALVAAAFAGAIVLASEMGGEVVTVITSDERGIDYETSLWVVDDAGQAWLRAGSTDSTWYQRLRRNPEIRMERGGEEREYEAVPVPEKTGRINELMARKYGVADRIVGLIRNEGASMAIRLDRRH